MIAGDVRRAKEREKNSLKFEWENLWFFYGQKFSTVRIFGAEN